jgi:polyhydroxyalkanoate synthase
MIGQSRMEQPGKAADADSSTVWWTYAEMARRRLGELMEHLGLGPQTTPSRTVGTWRTARLLAYQEPVHRATQGPVLLMVPAPIKTAYIWDLAPEVSAVRRCLAAGLQTYLVDWRPPQPHDEGMGLEDYASRMILACLDAVSAETKRSKIFLAGHSLGGTLAAIFASLHSDRLHGLIELEGPMEFKAGVGPIETVEATAPVAGTITDALGNVPGSFISAVSSWADPATFRSEPLLDWLACWRSPTAMTTHLRVRRWTLDETPMPRRLFQEVTEQLYRDNLFADGKLIVGRRRAEPHGLTAPILAVSDPRSRIIPWSSIGAYRQRTGSRDVQMLRYEGDVGVMLQHVGVLIGGDAHRFLWPRIIGWMRGHSTLQG